LLKTKLNQAEEKKRIFSPIRVGREKEKPRNLMGKKKSFPALRGMHRKGGNRGGSYDRIFHQEGGKDLSKKKEGRRRLHAEGKTGKGVLLLLRLKIVARVGSKKWGRS